MDLGICWQNGVWANGSWVDGSWCPSTPCTPESIGECWQIVWCSGTWVSSSWCISTPPIPPSPVITVDERRWSGPPIILYRETDVIPNWQRKREDEELIIL